MVHAGWRGLAGGVLEAGVAAAAGRRGRASTPRSGPAPGRAATRSATRSARALRRRAGRRSTSRPSRASGCAPPGVARGPRRRPLHDVRAPSAVLLPPPRRRRHRAPGGGRVAQLIRGLDAARVARTSSACATRSRADRPGAARRRRGAGRRQVRRARGAGVLAEAGLALAGREPRAGARGQGRRATAPTLTWDFIGHLQSRKVKQVLPLVRCPLGGSDSVLAPARAARARRRPRCSSRSTSPREEGKSGVAPDALDDVPRAAARRRVVGPDDDAAARRATRRTAAAGSPRSRELAAARGLRSCPWARRRTTGRRRRRARRSCGSARRCTGEWRGVIAPGEG